MLPNLNRTMKELAGLDPAQPWPAAMLQPNGDAPPAEPNPEKHYYILRMAGRCSNGAERDSGKLWHAVKGHRALCGAQPGRQSAGWSEEEGERVTCPKCVKKIPTLEAGIGALKKMGFSMGDDAGISGRSYDSRVALPWNPEHGPLPRIGVIASQPYDNKGAGCLTVEVTRETPIIATMEYTEVVEADRAAQGIANQTAKTIADIDKLIALLTEHRDRLMQVEIVKVGNA